MKALVIKEKWMGDFAFHTLFFYNRIDGTALYKYIKKSYQPFMPSKINK